MILPSSEFEKKVRCVLAVEKEIQIIDFPSP